VTGQRSIFRKRRCVTKFLRFGGRGIFCAGHRGRGSGVGVDVHVIGRGNTESVLLEATTALQVGENGEEN